jgi:hypothetical protein
MQTFDYDNLLRRGPNMVVPLTNGRHRRVGMWYDFWPNLNAYYDRQLRA